MLLLSLVVVVLPMLAFAPHLADQMVRETQRVREYFAATPEWPAWIGALPLGSRRLGAAWNRVAEVKGMFALLQAWRAAVSDQQATEVICILFQGRDGAGKGGRSRP